MKMKNFFAVIMCAFCFTACADIPPVRETVPDEEQTVTVPPENGWTAEELMSVSYFDGIRLSYPLTLRDLGSAYGVFFDIEDNDGNTVYFIGKDFITFDTYANVRVSPDLSEISPDAELTEFLAFPEKITVNGVRTGADSDAVISALGQPDSIEEYQNNISEYSYFDRNTGRPILTICLLADSDCVSAICLTNE